MRSGRSAAVVTIDHPQGRHADRRWSVVRPPAAAKYENCTCTSRPGCQTAVMGRGYGQHCPVAKGAEVFAGRWIPLILRNLHLGCRSFGEIHQGLPGMSRSLLSQRLASLERDGIVERLPSPSGRGWHWQLTSAGEELNEVGMALGTWAARWMELTPRDHDPAMVLWAWCRLLEPDRLP